MEAEILLNDQSSLSTMKQHLDASRAHKIHHGEIISARKILDVHLKLNDSKYGWEDHMIHDVARFSEGEISKNRVSAETLVHFWDFWKNKIVNIFEYLRSVVTQNVNDCENLGEFCLNYLAVRRQFDNLNPVYNLMIPNAYWVKGLDSRSIRSKGKFISLDAHQFASAARSYWGSELLSVGMDILAKLEGLYTLSVKNSSSLFCQSAKFLLVSKFLERRFHDNRALQRFVELPAKHLFSCVFPQDWRESLKENMISARRTGNFGDLVKEFTCEAVRFKKTVSYGQLGRILVAILGSCKLDNQLFEKIKDGFGSNESWMALIVDLCREIGLADKKSQVPGEETIMGKLHRVLEDIYIVNWRKAYDYISPECFLYLIERQLILVSCVRGHFFTTKSSFSEILVHMERNGSSISRLKNLDAYPIKAILDFLAHIVQQFLLCNEDTMEWIKRSCGNVMDRYRAVTLRLVVTACLLYLNFGYFQEFLFEWLGRNYIRNQLPSDFVVSLNRRQRRRSRNVGTDIEMFSEVFKEMGNPLVVVSLGENVPRFFPDVIILHMIDHSKEDMWTALFPNINKATQDQKKLDLDGAISSNMSVSLDVHDLQVPSNYREVLKSLKTLNNEEVIKSFIASVPALKATIEERIYILCSALEGCGDSDRKNGKPYGQASVMLDEMKQLYSVLDVREPELVKNLPRIEELLGQLDSKMARMDSFLDELFFEQDGILEEVVSETCHRPEEEGTSEAAKNGSSSQANLGNQEQDESPEEVVSETCHRHEEEGTSEAGKNGSSSQANLGNQASSSQAGKDGKGTSKNKKKQKRKGKGRKR